MGESFNPAEEISYLQYYDANNLYGWSMCQYLPVGDFRWIGRYQRERLTAHKIMNMSDQADTGYVLEVDLRYPPELHHMHNDLPLAPEHMTVKEENLSEYQRQLRDDTNSNPNSKVKKLIPNFNDKVRYVLHYRNLKYYLAMGMTLEKVHRVVCFTQKPWMRDYINFNTACRQAAKSATEKNMFKFLNNAVFGKTIMNLRKQQTIILTSCPKTAQRLIAKPTFESVQQINSDLYAFKMRRGKIFWTKPTYTGASILDLAKLHMYKFHYDVMVRQYGEKLSLLFTDTDSLCYHIVTKSLYKDMEGFIQHMDTSNFPKEHPCFSLVNDRKLGFFKDECGSVQALEFVGLRAKMYSLRMPDAHYDKLTAKGIKRSYAKKHLRHDMFLECLRNHSKTTASFRVIRSQNHELSTLLVVKDGLNPFDDKRYLLDDEQGRTLAYGHCDIPVAK